MRSTTLLSQTCQLKTQQLLDEMLVLKGSLISTGEKQELIDIVGNGIFFLENMKKDLNLVEKNIKTTQRKSDDAKLPFFKEVTGCAYRDRFECCSNTGISNGILRKKCPYIDEAIPHDVVSYYPCPGWAKEV